jgi:hypothetical protein
MTLLIHKNTHRADLRAKYREAFDEWALEVRRSQALAASVSDRKEADERVAVAESLYRTSRDQLTDDIGFLNFRTSRFVHKRLVSHDILAVAE